MTPYEWMRRLAEPGLPVIHGMVRRRLSRIIRESGLANPEILDVGGRRSPYTVGLPARVTLLDVPRSSEVQSALDLGFTDELLARVRRRRSNIAGIVLQDMTRCALPDGSFDIVTAVEVLEHVEEEDAFARHAARVLRPGGWALFTTPNGDFVPVTNPDHVRHPTRAGMEALLSRHFDEVEVRHAVRIGPARSRGLRTVRLSRPLEALGTLSGNVINLWESRWSVAPPADGSGMAHLFAVARRRR